MKPASLKGHQSQWEMLERSVQRNRLPHALLFVGPGGIGKRYFAKLFVQALFCSDAQSRSGLNACGECTYCKQVISGSHPDFHEFAPLADRNYLTLEVIVGSKVSKQEGLCETLSLKPTSASRKVAVIDQAHTMNLEAANALLKTLEEPLEQSVLVLISESEEALLPTIRSRCQMIRFHPLEDKDVAELLLEQEQVSSLAEAEKVAALCSGSLSQADHFLSSDYQSIRETIYQRLIQPKPKLMALGDYFLKSLDDLGGSPQDQKRYSLMMVMFLFEFYRDVQRTICQEGRHRFPQVQKYLSMHSEKESVEILDHAMRMIDRLVLCADQIETPSSVSLCLESLGDDLYRFSLD